MNSRYLKNHLLKIKEFSRVFQEIWCFADASPYWAGSPTVPRRVVMGWLSSAIISNFSSPGQAFLVLFCVIHPTQCPIIVNAQSIVRVEERKFQRRPFTLTRNLIQYCNSHRNFKITLGAGQLPQACLQHHPPMLPKRVASGFLMWQQAKWLVLWSNESVWWEVRPLRMSPEVQWYVIQM